jgi:general secretion pathway protein G
MRTLKAFTLVEILLVVMILGILAAIVLPEFSNATNVSKASMLADDLRIMRTQIEVFKSQHYDVPPGYPGCDPSDTPTEAAFVDQMTQASTAAGDLADPGTPGYRYGPYLRQVPVNPFNGKTSIEIVDVMPGVADESNGWVYCPARLQLKADSTGADEYGRSYFGY